MFDFFQQTEKWLWYLFTAYLALPRCLFQNLYHSNPQENGKIQMYHRPPWHKMLVQSIIYGGSLESR